LAPPLVFRQKITISGKSIDGSLVALLFKKNKTAPQEHLARKRDFDSQWFIWQAFTSILKRGFHVQGNRKMV
jgi:hypothetical protein